MEKELGELPCCAIGGREGRLENMLSLGSVSADEGSVEVEPYGP